MKRMLYSKDLYERVVVALYKGCFDTLILVVEAYNGCRNGGPLLAFMGNLRQGVQHMRCCSECLLIFLHLL